MTKYTTQAITEPNPCSCHLDLLTRGGTHPCAPHLQSQLNVIIGALTGFCFRPLIDIDDAKFQRIEPTFKKKAEHDEQQVLATSIRSFGVDSLLETMVH